MGMAKNRMMEEQDFYYYAQSILVEIRAISECEYHPGTFLDNEMDKSEMYARATAKHKEKSPGENIKRFQNVLETVIADCGDECYSCEKWKRE